MYRLATAKLKVVGTATAQTLIATARAERVVDGFGCCASRICRILKHCINTEIISALQTPPWRCRPTTV